MQLALVWRDLTGETQTFVFARAAGPMPVCAPGLSPLSRLRIGRMYQLPPSVARIVELEERQDDALRQLDELEHRVERALAEFSLVRLVPAPVLPADAQRN